MQLLGQVPFTYEVLGSILATGLCEKSRQRSGKCCGLAQDALVSLTGRVKIS